MWRRLKHVLFEKVPDAKVRALVICIEQHHDLAELDRLEHWAGSRQHYTGATALFVLSLLDPQRALAVLDSIEDFELYVSRNWWLPPLLGSQPGSVRQRIRARMEAQPDTFWNIAMVWQDREFEMDAETVHLLIDAFTDLLADCSANPPPPNHHPLFHPFRLLAAACSPEAIRRFRIRRGTPFEDLLVEFCLSRLRDNHHFADQIKDAAVLLERIGGEGFGVVVNELLESPQIQSRIDGLQLAMHSPRAADSERVRALSLSDDLTGVPEPGGPFQQAAATRLMAASGDDDGVVHALLKWGDDVSSQVAQLRVDHEPMTDSVLQPASVLLEDEDDRKRGNAVVAVGYSGRRDLIPRIREAARSCPPDAYTALATILASEYVQDNSDEATQYAARQLDVPRHRFAAARFLLWVNTEASLDAIESYLRGKANQELDATDRQIALGLAAAQPRALFVAKLFWERIQSDGVSMLDVPKSIFTVVGSLRTSDVREFLVNWAYRGAGDAISGQARVGAILGLAAADPDEAMKAAQLALAHQVPGREDLPSLLLDLDENRATQILLEHAPNEPSTLVRWMIACAFRNCIARSNLESAVQTMLTSDEVAVREAGADVGAWQGAGFLNQQLKEQALHDPSRGVRQACQAAIEFKRIETVLRDLMACVGRTQGLERSAAIHGLIRFGNPLFFMNAGGMLSETLDIVDPSSRWTISDQLRRSRERVEREAERRDRERNRN